MRILILFLTVFLFQCERAPLHYEPLPANVHYPWLDPQAQAQILLLDQTTKNASFKISNATSIALMSSTEMLVEQLQEELSACTPQSPRRTREHRSSRELVLINLNSSSRRELENLPRIGPAMAERIIAARPFESIDELENVRGIGSATMRRLRPLIRVGEM